MRELAWLGLKKQSSLRNLIENKGDFNLEKYSLWSQHCFLKQGRFSNCWPNSVNLKEPEK